MIFSSLHNQWMWLHSVKSDEMHFITRTIIFSADDDGPFIIFLHSKAILITFLKRHDQRSSFEIFNLLLLGTSSFPPFKKSLNIARQYRGGEDHRFYWTQEVWRHPSWSSTTSSTINLSHHNKYKKARKTSFCKLARIHEQFYGMLIFKGTLTAWRTKKTKIWCCCLRRSSIHLPTDTRRRRTKYFIFIKEKRYDHVQQRNLRSDRAKTPRTILTTTIPWWWWIQ